MGVVRSPHDPHFHYVHTSRYWWAWQMKYACFDQTILVVKLSDQTLQNRISLHSKHARGRLLFLTTSLQFDEVSSTNQLYECLEYCNTSNLPTIYQLITLCLHASLSPPRGKYQECEFLGKALGQGHSQNKGTQTRQYSSVNFGNVTHPWALLS